MKKDILKYCLCLPVIILPALTSFEAISQEKDWGYLTFKGEVLFNDEGLGGAKVVLYKNGVKMREMTTSNNGKFTIKAEREIFQLSPKDDKYIVQISKPAHVTLNYSVHTKVPADIKPLWPTCEFSVDLFKMPIDKVKEEKALMSILENPISVFAYNPKKRDFDDDKAYFSTIQARVEQLFNILDADEAEQYKLIAAYRLKKIEEEKRRQAEAEAKARSLEVKLEEEAAKRAEEENLAMEAAARRAEEERLAKAAEGGNRKPETEEVSPAVFKKDKETEALRSFKEAEEAKKAEAEKNMTIKAERENEILEVMAEKERLEREKSEEINRQRKETETNALIEKMKIETRVIAEYKPIEAASREKVSKTAENEKVKAQDTKRLIAMVAEKEVSQKRTEYMEAVPDSNGVQDPAGIKERPGTSYSAEKKYRPGVQERSEQDISGSHWVYKFTPEIVSSMEKGILKTVKTTVIIFPTKHNTLQEVNYAWGTSYYYLNGNKIDEETYLEELKNPEVEK